MTARHRAIRKGASTVNTPVVLDLENSVTVVVSMIANRITNSGSAIFRARHSLGSTDWKVLSTIAVEPAVTGMRISQLVGLDRSAVSRVLKHFAAAGLVEIGQSDRQSNYQEVTLTEAGQKLHDEAILTAFEREDFLIEPFSDAERVLLLKLLHRLLARASRLGDVDGPESKRRTPA